MQQIKLPLVRQPRLSVMPVTPKEFEEILVIGSKKEWIYFYRLYIFTYPYIRTTPLAAKRLCYEAVIDNKEQLTDNGIE